MSEYDKVRELITRQAADWLIANREGLVARERKRFTAWLKASPVHVEEYLALTVMTRDLREACAESAGSVEALLQLNATATVTPLGPSRDAFSFGWLQSALAAATSVAVLVFCVLAWHSYQPTARPTALTATDASQHFATRHGEQETRRLADQSILQLNTDSAATVRYDATQRLIVLESGEAVFEVAPEANRPFKVRAGSTEIRALGTEFAVRLADDTAWVTVLEGRVAVGPNSVQLIAGQQLQMSKGTVLSGPLTVDTQRTTAWLRRQIVFEREPLERVAAEFNRYTFAPIEIASPGLRNLEISGVFATDDTDAFIAFLRSLDGVHVEVTPTHVRVSRD